MPKPYTFPILADEVLQISISKLKEWKYLNLEILQSGTLTWRSNEKKTASISIEVNTYKEPPHIELSYKFNDKPRNYKVQLISIPSNLGKGVIWFFVCPKTNKRCRKLYSVDGYFYHREAFCGVMYESQTRSKAWRQMQKTFGKAFRIEEAYEQLYSKHFKTFYNGKPTKRYLRLLKMIHS